MNKIAILLKQNEKSWEYANGIAQRMFQVGNINQLDAHQLRKVLIALNYQNLKQQADTVKKT